ncbi:sel1 repeat family protein, partial [Roseicella aquatilis]
SDLYRRAAEAGLPAAQAALGRMLLAGAGLPRDVRRGEEWLRRAAMGGDAAAGALLAQAATPRQPAGVRPRDGRVEASAPPAGRNRC